MKNNKIIKRTTHQSLLKEYQYEHQSMLQKLTTEHQQTPIEECKMILKAMKEVSEYQKFIVTQYMDVTVPNSSKLQKCKSADHRNYQKLAVYSKKRLNVQCFQKKYCKQTDNKQKHHTLNLKSIIDKKKLKLLTEENKCNQNDIEVQILLKNQDDRVKMFNQTLLVERFIALKKQKRVVQSQKGNKSLQNQLKPKHFHLNQTHNNMDAFYRRQFVTKKHTFQFFSNISNFQYNLTKQQQYGNNAVFRNMLQYYDSHQASDKLDKAKQTNKCIHQLFLNYSNNQADNPQQLYSFVDRQKILQFMMDFDIDYKLNQQIIDIVNSNKINYLTFSQIIHILSRKDNKIFNTDISTFLSKQIQTQPSKYLPKQYIYYKQHQDTIDHLLHVKKTLQKLYIICSRCSNRSQSKINKTVSFDQLMEVMWALKLYPVKTNKKKLYFYFVFVQNDQAEISIKEVLQILMLIALTNSNDHQKSIINMTTLIAKASKGELQQ